MEVNKKSVFSTSFGRDRFQENLSSFENESDLQIIYLTSPQWAPGYEPPPLKKVTPLFWPNPP